MDSANPNQGWSYPANDNIFRQNQLKLSVNKSIKARIEEYRYKELVDSFLEDEEMEWVNTLLECLQGYDEINQELIRLLDEEVTYENKRPPFIANKPHIVIDYEKEVCLTPTVNRIWAESKNICQLSKSRKGIGVRTASTQKLIHEERSRSRIEDASKEKKGFFGNNQENNQVAVEEW